MRMSTQAFLVHFIWLRRRFPHQMGPEILATSPVFLDCSQLSRLLIIAAVVSFSHPSKNATFKIIFSGPVASFHTDKLVNAFLSLVKESDEMLRASALSSLADLCFVSTRKIMSSLQEVRVLFYYFLHIVQGRPTKSANVWIAVISLIFIRSNWNLVHMYPITI